MFVAKTSYRQDSHTVQYRPRYEQQAIDCAMAIQHPLFKDCHTQFDVSLGETARVAKGPFITPQNAGHSDEVGGVYVHTHSLTGLLLAHQQGGVDHGPL